MHVALLANTAWLDEELSSFRHLVVGLLGEQVRVAQVVPQFLPLDEPSVFGERIHWHESRWGAINRVRLMQLARPLRELQVELVHVLDGRLWPGAATLARRLERPAVFNANSHLDIRLVEAVTRRLGPQLAAITATTEPIARALRERLGDEYTLETIQPGAHPGEPVRRRKPDDPLCVIVSGNGRLDARYASLLEGLRRVTQRSPGSQFFFDGQGSDQHEIWQAASRLGLLSNLSMIPRRLGHRELLVRADVLIHPQPLGRSRTLTIQAMAHALPVVAQDDPWLDYLHDEETARVVHDPDPSGWAQVLLEMIADPDRGHALGASAQGWIRANRLASRQLERVLALYYRLLGHTIPFPG
ncbi:MAG: glycosyltransferase family 4 protein [Phycisphaeraceae bacterium]